MYPIGGGERNFPFWRGINGNNVFLLPMAVTVNGPPCRLRRYACGPGSGGIRGVVICFTRSQLCEVEGSTGNRFLANCIVAVIKGVVFMGVFLLTVKA